MDLKTGTIHTLAEVAFPQGIAVDAAGTVYVSETAHCRLLAIEPLTGSVTALTGTSSNCTLQGGDGGAGGGRNVFSTNGAGGGGFADLAVGVPFEDTVALVGLRAGTVTDAGAVNVNTLLTSHSERLKGELL